AIPILDASDRYLGLVSLADLLEALPVRPRPPMVGGMATPFGVYLTNGSIQAGAGNVALMAGGALLGFLLTASRFGVGLFAWLTQKALGAPFYAWWSGPEPTRIDNQAFGWMLMNSLAVPLFLSF